MSFAEKKVDATGDDERPLIKAVTERSRPCFLSFVVP